MKTNIQLNDDTAIFFIDHCRLNSRNFNKKFNQIKLNTNFVTLNYEKRSIRCNINNSLYYYIVYLDILGRKPRD